VLRDVPPAERCRCDQEKESRPKPGSQPRAWLRGLFRK
jgi:hypothetical protein